MKNKPDGISYMTMDLFGQCKSGGWVSAVHCDPKEYMTWIFTKLNGLVNFKL